MGRIGFIGRLEEEVRLERELYRGLRNERVRRRYFRKVADSALGRNGVLG